MNLHLGLAVCHCHGLARAETGLSLIGCTILRAVSGIKPDAAVAGQDAALGPVPAPSCCAASSTSDDAVEPSLATGLAPSRGWRCCSPGPVRPGRAGY